MRSYSLSSAPGAGTYRISVKQEPHGVASSYLNQHLEPGALLEVAAPRGDFALDDGTGPVLLISAGIGVTPGAVHAAPARRRRQRAGGVVAVRGARTARAPVRQRRRTPCSPPCRTPASTSSTARPRRPSATARTPPPGGSPGRGWPGCASRPPRRAAYICGPASFMADMRDALTALGVGPRARSTPSCSARWPPSTPGSPRSTARRRTSRPGRREPGRWSPSPAAASPRRSATPGAACSTSPTPATCPPGGAAAPASATPASRPCCPATSATPLTPLEPPADGQILICCARPEHRPRPGHVAQPICPCFLLPWRQKSGTNPPDGHGTRSRKPASCRTIGNSYLTDRFYIF